MSMGLQHSAYNQPVGDTWETWINKCLPGVLSTMMARGMIGQIPQHIIADYFNRNVNAFIQSLPAVQLRETEFENYMADFIANRVLPALTNTSPYQGFSGFNHQGFQPQGHPAQVNYGPAQTMHGSYMPRQQQVPPASLLNRNESPTNYAPSPYTSGDPAQTPAGMQRAEGEDMHREVSGEPADIAELLDVISDKHRITDSVATIRNQRFPSVDGEVAVNEVTFERGFNNYREFGNIREGLLPPIKQSQTFDIYSFKALDVIDVPASVIKLLFEEIGKILRGDPEQVDSGNILDKYESVLKVLENQPPRVTKEVSTYLTKLLNEFLRRYVFFSDDPVTELSVDDITEFEEVVNISNSGVPRFETYSGYYELLNQIAENIFGKITYSCEDEYGAGIICDPFDPMGIGDCLHASGNQHIVGKIMNRDYSMLIEDTFKATGDDRIMAEKAHSNFLTNGVGSRTVLRQQKHVIVTNHFADFNALSYYVGRIVPRNKVRAVDLLTDYLISKSLLEKLPIADIVFPDQNVRFSCCFGLGDERPFIKRM